MDIFDEKLALEKVDGNRELMLELLGMMIAELPKNIAELEQALQNGNKDDKWNIAHKLTGSTAYCGVPALQACARTLEKAIKDEQTDIASCFAAVKCEVDNIIQYHRDHFS